MRINNNSWLRNTVSAAVLGLESILAPIAPIAIVAAAPLVVGCDNGGGNEDTTGPTVANELYGSFYEDELSNFSVEVDDPSGVLSVALQYRLRESSDSWTEQAMVNSIGLIYDTDLSGLLSEEYETRFVAMDTKGNETTTVVDNFDVYASQTNALTQIKAVLDAHIGSNDGDIDSYVIRNLPDNNGVTDPDPTVSLPQGDAHVQVYGYQVLSSGAPYQDVVFRYPKGDALTQANLDDFTIGGTQVENLGPMVDKYVQNEVSTRLGL